MTDDLNLGDHAWLRVRVEQDTLDPAGNRFVSHLYREDNGARHRSEVLADSSDVVPYFLPSEQSETAELDARIVEAAEAWFDDDSLTGNMAENRVSLAIQAKREALAPPSLEDEIKSLLRDAVRSTSYKTTVSQAVDVLAENVMALVKAHES